MSCCIKTIKVKNIFFVVLLVFNFRNAVSQSIFKIVPARRNDIIHANPSRKEDSKYYRIILPGDSLYKIRAYPLPFTDTSIDTIEAIGELLKMRGDTRICALPIMCYNPLVSQLYMGTTENYSIQVEALFIVNQLAFEKAFFYSPYPVLVDKINRSQASISGKVIDDAYEAYYRWYKKLKKIGMRGIRSGNIMPLDDAKVRWY